MKFSNKTGTALAATAAMLLISGTTIGATGAEAGMGKKVACFGVNACKGQGACKTASNACKGQNACKGKGFIELTKADCKAKGGKIMMGDKMKM